MLYHSKARNINKDMEYYNLSVQEAFNNLNSPPAGLSAEEAGKRLEKYGENQLKEGKRKSIFKKIFQQIFNPMIIILLAASVVSGLLGETADMLIIFFVVIINTAMGLVQEGKAENSIRKLKSLSLPFTYVKRNGVIKQILSKELVIGDIVMLQSGDVVPADMRIISCNYLKAEEAALTGESVPSEKTEKALEGKKQLGDRKNMLFSASKITCGTASCIVTATGMNTEVGKIANILRETKQSKTPLQKQMDKLSEKLSVGILIICAVIFIISLIWAQDMPVNLFLKAVSIAAAVIPEGLVAVITLVLALGVQKMSQKNAIIRKISAVETLGCVQFICSDKTGTLTQNKMKVKENYTWHQKDGDLSSNKHFLNALVLCNDASVSGEEIGDPTEIALLKLGLDYSIDKDSLSEKFKRIHEIPFDSDRKMMSTVHENSGRYLIYTKGAVDNILRCCNRILINNEVRELTDDYKREILKANGEIADKALRVLAAAYREDSYFNKNENIKYFESSLIFLGLTGMEDPPREDCKEAIKVCKEAGINTLMITGDHMITAVAIAKQLNLIESGAEAMHGEQLAALSDTQFNNAVIKYKVFARVSPEQKVKIVNALKAQGYIVAITGDGVNDAPALKSADIGVGMGITGTDVAKDVSDMVLADDNFSTIVYAVKEGRRIFTNLRKSIHFMLSTNISEIVLLLFAAVFGLNVLETVQILFVNLITDTFPAVALGFEVAENDIMKKPPRSAKEGFFANGSIFTMIIQGFLMAFISFLAFTAGNLVNHATAITMAFATLSLLQVLHALNMRSAYGSVFSKDLLKNKFMVYSVLGLTAFIIVIISVPQISVWLHCTPLTLMQWLTVFALSMLIIVYCEVIKIFGRKSMRGAQVPVHRAQGKGKEAQSA